MTSLGKKERFRVADKIQKSECGAKIHVLVGRQVSAETAVGGVLCDDGLLL